MQLAQIVLMKRSPCAIAFWLSIIALTATPGVINAGPFGDFFSAVRRSTAHPDYKPRSHQGIRARNESPPDAGQTTENSGYRVVAPPGRHNIRMAKATWATDEREGDLAYGIPVPGKKGLVTSPFAPDSGYVGVGSFSPGTEVKDPYTGKIFPTP